MAANLLRGVIVGASSLLGRELAEELEQTSNAAWELTLVDANEAAGGAEERLIQPLTPESFTGANVAFFAGDGATARQFWKTAHNAGAAVVDLTGALAGLPGILLLGAWTQQPATPGLAAAAVSLGHPAAIILAVAVERLQGLGPRRVAATVLEPASQQGRAGVEELHQQTIALLSFKPLVKDVFDAQTAFNLCESLGGEAKVNLADVAARIARESAELTGAKDVAITVQVLQAPVFHGSTLSVFVELTSSVEESAVRRALHGVAMRVASSDEGVSNESVAGQGEIAISVRSAEVGQIRETRPGPQAIRRNEEQQGTAFWLWMAADNLRLLARSAASCAAELAVLPPVSDVN